LPPFRPLSEAELQRLDDDALIDYMRRAREAGDRSAWVALAIMVHGRWSMIEQRVRLKVPDAYVEDLTGDIVADALTSAFNGTSVGEFSSWLSTITRRAIADFWRRGPGRGLREEATEGERLVASDEGLVSAGDALDRVLARLSPDHRRVIDIFVFDDGTAADAVRAVPGMTEANVNKIVSRFRQALRQELEAGGDTGSA
jgi:DNA-directed RNA polymerase specialized sigma24 family protein